MTIQWHPIFAKLLKPHVERDYEIQLNVPVGEAPRLADILLLRRLTRGRQRLGGVWRYLTTWNVLEFKGPTVSARVGHLDLLIELGLGIHRRLNEQREKQRLEPLGAEEVSIWYLANHLGKRFLRDAAAILGPLEACGPGVWRCVVLRRPVLLVSSADLPLEEDNLPLQVLSKGKEDAARAVANYLTTQPSLWERFGGWLAFVHPGLWEEVRAMARTSKLPFPLKPLVDEVGLKRVVEEVGMERVIREVGGKRILEAFGEEQLAKDLNELMEAMPPAQRQEFIKKLTG